MKAIRNSLVTVLLITSALISLAGCSEKTPATETTLQTTTVQRGNLSNIITAAGNLALAKTEDLAVDIFYQQGTITEVLVEVGDSVTQGQVLARIDGEEWQEQIDALETSLVTAQRNLTTKEQAMLAAERSIKTKELACQTAKINLDAAQYALESINEVKEIQDKIDILEARLVYIDNTILYADDADKWAWGNHKQEVEQQLADYVQDKNDILAGNNLTITDSVALEIQRKLLSIDTACLNMESATDDLNEALLNLDYATVDVDTARKQLSSISNTLEEAQEKSPDVIAPFDGFIVALNVKGGDEVIRGKVAVQIADPNQFQADIFVNEVDILQVGIGTIATVAADAITGVSFPASVTHISPTATITSGVVNYLVRVELTPMDELATGFGSLGDIDKSEGFPIPEGFEPPEGFEFPTELEAPEGFEIPEGFQPPSGNFGGMIGFTSGTLDDLRDGMSVTVSLIISSEENVLLVPYTSVTVTGGKSYVQVILDNGETEQREVTTGSTNYTNIVIAEGLEEGETIVVPEGTITGDFSQFQFGSGMMFPGMGGGGR